MSTALNDSESLALRAPIKESLTVQPSDAIDRQSCLVLKYPLEQSEQCDILTASAHASQNKRSVNEIGVDIIATHGLGADGATWVWKHNDGAKCDWLGDLVMLPSYVPNSRIYFFEWDAGFEEDAVDDILLGHADNMLADIHAMRNPTKDSDSDVMPRNQRPIVFVVSCFGGLVLMKALHRASERNSKYGNILEKTVGISFMGVPFRGSHSTLHDTCLLRASIGLQLGFGANSYLVHYLLHRNDELDELVKRFCQMVEHDELRFTIVCFFETRPADYTKAMQAVKQKVEDGMTQSSDGKNLLEFQLSEALAEKLKESVDSDLTMIVVERRSACIDGKKSFGLHVQHSGLKRFPNQFDKNFDKVAREIRELVDDAGMVLAKKDTARPLVLSQHAEVIAEWLSTVNFKELQRIYLKVRHKDTCHGFLTDPKFLAWAQNTDTPTLFCPGIPGAGKTTTVAAAVHHLQEHTQAHSDVAVLYLYCDDQLRDSASAAGFIRCLLKQLLVGRLAVPHCILTMYQKYLKDGLDVEDDKLLQALILVISTTYSTVFILVNALDECPPAPRELFLSYLSTLQQTCKQVKLLATSMFSEVQEHFKLCPNLEIYARKDEVEAYLRSQLQQPGVMPDVITRDASLQSEILVSISTATDGMFMLASEILSLLKTSFLPGDIRATLNIFEASPTEPSTTAQEKLLKVFQVRLNRLGDQPAGAQKLAKSALLWVTFAQRPLTPTELRHAVATKNKERDAFSLDDVPSIVDIIRVCTGFLHIDPFMGVVRPFHRKAAEFLETNAALILNIGGTHDDRLSFHQIRQAALHAHRRITRSCISYMMSFDYFWRVGCQNKFQLKALQKDNVLLEYAASTMLYHANKANMNSDSRVLGLLQTQISVAAMGQCITSNWGRFWDMNGLHIASLLGNEEVVINLLRRGYDPLARTSLISVDDVSQHALGFAAAGGHLKAFTVLLIALRGRHKDDNVVDDVHGQIGQGFGSDLLIAQMCLEFVAFGTVNPESSWLPEACAGDFSAIKRSLVNAGVKFEAHGVDEMRDRGWQWRNGRDHKRWMMGHKPRVIRIKKLCKMYIGDRK